MLGFLKIFFQVPSKTWIFLEVFQKYFSKPQSEIIKKCFSIHCASLIFQKIFFHPIVESEKIFFQPIVLCGFCSKILFRPIVKHLLFKNVFFFQPIVKSEFFKNIYFSEPLCNMDFFFQKYLLKPLCNVDFFWKHFSNPIKKKNIFSTHFFRNIFLSHCAK